MQGLEEEGPESLVPALTRGTEVIIFRPKFSGVLGGGS